MNDMQIGFLQKADAALPHIHTIECRPAVAPTVLREAGESITLDLGTHYVGRLSFVLWYVEDYIDAPVKLRVRFCEVAQELPDDDSAYHGWLCPSWQQEEIVTIDRIGTYTLPRRYAARYVKITLLQTPKPLCLRDFVFCAESSADMGALKPLPPTEPTLARIDEVAVRTLHNCMQRVFEDGPKRDRRLWIGDLRLEALADYYTFGQTDIVRRCLYLFAASDRDALGFLPGFVYEDPVFFSGSWHLQDYSLMFVAALCDYLAHTADAALFAELRPVAEDILASTHALCDANGIAMPTDAFIDWCEGLEKTAAFHGVYLYTLNLWCQALRSLSEDAAIYEQRLSCGRAAAHAHLFDADACCVRSTYDKEQRSVHATAWLILGGALSQAEAQRAMIDILADAQALQPFTPYMHHYTVDALLHAGLREQAIAHIHLIWGGMLDQGADTFFEAFVPADPTFSPYGDHRVNSMCHAWSCTPAYFIRKYGFGRL